MWEGSPLAWSSSSSPSLVQTHCANNTSHTRCAKFLLLRASHKASQSYSEVCSVLNDKEMRFALSLWPVSATNLNARRSPIARGTSADPITGVRSRLRVCRTVCSLVWFTIASSLRGGVRYLKLIPCGFSGMPNQRKSAMNRNEIREILPQWTPDKVFYVRQVGGLEIFCAWPLWGTETLAFTEQKIGENPRNNFMRPPGPPPWQSSAERQQNTWCLFVKIHKGPRL